VFIERTYSGTLASSTKLDTKIFTERGGTSVVSDAAGNVYIASGEVHIYDGRDSRLECSKCRSDHAAWRLADRTGARYLLEHAAPCARSATLSPAKYPLDLWRGSRDARPDAFADRSAMI
jgi:hypothetical protein